MRLTGIFTRMSVKCAWKVNFNADRELMWIVSNHQQLIIWYWWRSPSVSDVGTHHLIDDSEYSYREYLIPFHFWLFKAGIFSMLQTLWFLVGFLLAECPDMSFVLVCWHSRKWEPPICSGLLQMLLLRLQNFKWTDYFCKKSISYTNCQLKIKKQDKKRAKTL